MVLFREIRVPMNSLHALVEEGLDEVQQVFRAFDSEWQRVDYAVPVNCEHRRGRRVEELVTVQGGEIA